MRLYFAYGSNMQKEQMKCRCPDHRFVGVGVLFGYRWIINSRGVANIVISPPDHVCGAVYEISISDEQTLDRKEGVRSGAYRKETISVEINQMSLDCLVYIDPTTDEGLPRPEYIKKINDGILDVGLPMDYVERYIRKYKPGENK